MLVRILVPILLILGAIGVTTLMVIARPEAKQVDKDPPRLLVETIRARREDVSVTVPSQGNVEPRTRTSLVSEVSGQIVSVSPTFVAGGFFRRGDVLLKIDPRNYEAAVTQSQANVARARTALVQEQALAEYASEDFETARALQAIKAQQATALTLRQPQLAQAQAELDSALAALDKARDDLDRCTIRAPYDGLVRSKLSDVGQFVNPGTPLAEAFAVDFAEVRLPLTAADLAYLDLPEGFTGTTDQTVPVTLHARIGGRRHSWDARIVRTEGVFDAQTRVLYAVAQIDDPYGLNTDDPEPPLRIGTFVEADIQGRRLDGVFRIPRHALRPGNTLWVVDDGERLARAQVTVERADDEWIYASAGIADGTRVTLTPLDNPLPGSPVRVLDP